MPPKPKAAARGEYIETETGNKISRRASILGPKHIILAGKCVIQHDVVVRGDLVRPAQSQPKPLTTTIITTTNGAPAKPPPTETAVSIHLGRYVFVSPHVTLHPPSRITQTTQQQKVTQYHPLRISDDVYIGPHTHIQAASIGSHVSIGANCNVGNLVIIKDNVRVEDGTVLPAGSVWSSGTVVAGRPGRVVGELGEGWSGGAAAGGFEGVGTGCRERWAAVGNKR